MGIVVCGLGAEFAVLVTAAEPSRDDTADLYLIAEKLSADFVGPIEQIIEVGLTFDKQAVNFGTIELFAVQYSFCKFFYCRIHKLNRRLTYGRGP
jgi:hypothetical protein